MIDVPCDVNATDNATDNETANDTDNASNGTTGSMFDSQGIKIENYNNDSYTWRPACVNGSRKVPAHIAKSVEMEKP